MAKWKVAKKKQKRFKILLIGDTGTFKTRTSLRLTNRSGEPAIALIDNEGGSDFYGDEFNFLVLKSPYLKDVEIAIDQILKNPGQITTLGIDSMSIFCEDVASHFVDLFLKRELGSPGCKRDYYTLQPRDWIHINRRITALIKKLIDCDLNIVATCQVKDLWQDMKVIGKTFDGFKRLPYYFDIVLRIEPADAKNSRLHAIVEKDRTHCLPLAISWDNDKVAYKALVEAFGSDLASGTPAQPVKQVKEKQGEEKPDEGVFVTRDQLQAIRELKNKIGIDAKEWAKLLKPWNVKSAKALSRTTASDFIAKLTEMVPSEARGTSKN